MWESTHAPYGQKSAQLDCSRGINLVSFSRALQERVKINLFFTSLTPKLNTHRKWDIIRKRNRNLNIFIL